jgi:DNA repair protein RecN (Recombination protein N)
MEGARFEVQVAQEEAPDGCFVDSEGVERRLRFDSTGIDSVEFLIAANRGEPLRPLVKVASGGETARIMLALKSVLSRADPTPTLIFDEIDQGIGGRVGATVGQKLWNLSDGHQVLCVTHLAQLAGFGDAHFRVTKGARGDRVVTAITPLDDKARVEELADMLGAETVNAKQSAHDILMLARRAKEGKGVQSPLM